MSRKSTPMGRFKVGIVALSATSLCALTACGPSADFTDKTSNASAMVQGIAASAPPDYEASSIEGGQWPNEGRGPNVWTNLKLQAKNIDASNECRRLIAWARTRGAITFTDGNDGSNPVIDFAGNEDKAQRTCQRMLAEPLRATAPIGGSLFILFGKYIRNGTQTDWPFQLDINAGVDAIQGSTALQPWVNVFVVSNFP